MSTNTKRICREDDGTLSVLAEGREGEKIKA